MPSWRPAIEGFEGDETLASRSGARIFRFGVHQGHDERSVLKDFTAWEVATGFQINYSTNYLIENSHFYAAAKSYAPEGFVEIQNAENITLKDVDFNGFAIGIHPGSVLPFPRSLAPTTPSWLGARPRPS